MFVAMAHLGRGPYKTGDIAAKLGKQSTTVAPLRGHLINKGLVFGPSYGMTDFTVPQFDDFLRHNFPAPTPSKNEADRSLEKDSDPEFRLKKEASETLSVRCENLMRIIMAFRKLHHRQLPGFIFRDADTVVELFRSVPQT
mgnify:FL=1